MNSATGCVRCLGLRESDIWIRRRCVVRHSRYVTKGDGATVHLQRSAVVDTATIVLRGVAGDSGVAVEGDCSAVVEDAATIVLRGVAGDCRIAVEGYRPEVEDAATVYGGVAGDSTAVQLYRPGAAVVHAATNFLRGVVGDAAAGEFHHPSVVGDAATTLLGGVVGDAAAGEGQSRCATGCAITAVVNNTATNDFGGVVGDAAVVEFHHPPVVVDAATFAGGVVGDTAAVEDQCRCAITAVVKNAATIAV